MQTQENQWKNAKITNHNQSLLIASKASKQTHFISIFYYKQTLAILHHKIHLGFLGFFLGFLSFFKKVVGIWDFLNWEFAKRLVATYKYNHWYKY